MVQLKCFHGTSYTIAHKILEEKRFLESEVRDSLRMGRGAYFFGQYGNSPICNEYPIRCARQMEEFHRNHVKKHLDGYGILSCDVQCDDIQFLDLCDPEKMQFFHMLRYQSFEDAKRQGIRFENAEIADTFVFNILREQFGYSVIRSPQFFGMFEQERTISFTKGKQFPKTFVPNVIIVCVDVNKATIQNIEIVEERSFDDDIGSIV